MDQRDNIATSFQRPVEPSNSYLLGPLWTATKPRECASGHIARRRARTLRPFLSQLLPSPQKPTLLTAQMHNRGKEETYNGD